MHTFLSAKIWIYGLKILQKLFVHLHTQFNRDILWETIDIDFMNLDQGAYEDRKFEHVCLRTRINGKFITVKLGGEGTTTLKQSVVTRWLSLFSCAESVYNNYDAVLLALESRRATRYIDNLTKYNLIDLLLLLAPLNAALQAIQTDETPSLHLVVPFYQKLLDNYSTYSKLVSSAKKKYPSIFQSSLIADYLLTESDEFFRRRIHAKLIEIFIFDDHHYMAMCLHPALREMDDVPHQIRTNCYMNIRKYLQDNELNVVDAPANNVSSSRKKRKLLHKFLDEDDDDDDDDEEKQIQSTLDQNVVLVDDDNIDLIHKTSMKRSSSVSSLSTEFSYKTNYQAFKPDELDQYLEADLPSSIVKENPLQFWSGEFATSKFPLLKCLARKLFSIPATSSETERLFSYSGIILNNRRQRLSPDQVDNMLVIRRARKVLTTLKNNDSINK
ncbi:unnamed protein product [Rotaria sp. Silwood2]|nr:unnamed protein product [Rotaria sp. Silwood2]